MLHHLSNDGFRRFSLARPQTVRMRLKSWGDPLTAAGFPSHETNPQHIHTCIKIQLWAWCCCCAVQSSHMVNRLTRQLASHQMAFQICSAPFVYFSDFGGVWKSSADSAPYSDVIAGFCSCRVAGKMYTLVLSRQLKFYYKWFHICTPRGEKTAAQPREVASVLGANHVKRSEPYQKFTQQQASTPPFPPKKQDFVTTLLSVLSYFRHCCH